MPFGRIIIRIIVFAMSAQFVHIPAHMAISADIIMDPAHIVHACSQAEQDSMHSCITAMSMPCIESECISIICIAAFDIVSVQPGLSGVGGSGAVANGPIQTNVRPGAPRCLYPAGAASPIGSNHDDSLRAHAASRFRSGVDHQLVRLIFEPPAVRRGMPGALP